MGGPAPGGSSGDGSPLRRGRGRPSQKREQGKARKEPAGVRFPAHIAFAENGVADIHDHHHENILAEILCRRLGVTVPAANEHIGARAQKPEHGTRSTDQYLTLTPIHNGMGKCTARPRRDEKHQKPPAFQMRRDLRRQHDDPCRVGEKVKPPAMDENRRQRAIEPNRIQFTAPEQVEPQEDDHISV